MSLLFNDNLEDAAFKNGVFPKTRYQGSKYKLAKWLAGHLSDIPFHSVLDAFSGTSAVSYMFKSMGKQVIVNDKMKFNYIIGKAFIENNDVTVNDEDISFVLTKREGFVYKNIISNNFSGIYYLNEENSWLDIVVQNIHQMQDEYKKAIMFWALYQACLSKRPYNLFHRSNLYVRTAEVKRSFGNKTTWDKPFESHFLNFIKEANLAIFNNGFNNLALNNDVANLSADTIDVDLVYLDPPYVPKKGSLTLYLDFYHFLEGLTEYDSWEDKIDRQSKNKKMLADKSPWEDRKLISAEFFRTIKKFEKSKIAISYREDGIPSITEITDFLESCGKKVDIKYVDYKYALSKKNNVREVLIIGW
jgi:adenine-specific DNA methylase